MLNLYIVKRIYYDAPHYLFEIKNVFHVAIFKKCGYNMVTGCLKT